MKFMLNCSMDSLPKQQDAADKKEPSIYTEKDTVINVKEGECFKINVRFKDARNMASKMVVSLY
jgi:hypothetical protein